jgi:predicted dehydrogenase
MAIEPLRIGIAGAGAIAQRNAREAVASGAAKVVGVFDVNHKVARDMGNALKAPFYSTYEELLARPELEAVLISTPHHLHRPMTVQAAMAGKHVMVEKPMANNLAEAEEMVRVCRERNVRLAVNYSFRFLPKIRQAKALIDAGALGTITGVQIISHQFKDPGYWTGARSNSPDDWRASREKCGGGYLIMNVCHIIDYIYFLTGLKAERVYSEYATLGSPAEVEDIISVSMRLDNGAVGSISASSIMRGADQSEERIWGTNGSLILNGDGISFYSTRPIDGRRPGKMHTISKFADVSWTAEWVKQFAESVRAGREPEVSFREGWENLALIRGAYESLESQKPVQIVKYESLR